MGTVGIALFQSSSRALAVATLSFSCSSWSWYYPCNSVTKLCAPQGQGLCPPCPTVSSGPSTEPNTCWHTDSSAHQLDENLTAVSVLRTSLDSRLRDKKVLSVLRSDTYADDSVGWPNAGSRGWDGSFRRSPVLWERQRQKGWGAHPNLVGTGRDRV